MKCPNCGRKMTKKKKEYICISCSNEVKNKSTENTRKAIKINQLIEEIKQNNLYVKQTNLCISCHENSVYTLDDWTNQKTSMTCERLQCKRAFLLGEPACCPKCSSLNFEREQPYNEDSLYNCYNCKKRMSIGRSNQIETLPMNEEST